VHRKTAAFGSRLLRAVLVSTSAWVPAGCRNEVRTDAMAVPEEPATAPGPHGGAVGERDGVRVEVVPDREGRVEVYVSSTNYQSISSERAMGWILVDGGRVPVFLARIPALEPFVGRAVGVAPGRHRFLVDLLRMDSGRPLEVPVPDVRLDRTLPIPAPAHGGDVVVVGSTALEVVASRCGDVAIFPREVDGAPTDPASMAVTSLRALRDGDELPGWMLRTAQGFVGRIDRLAPGPVDLAMDFVSHGESYLGLRLPGVLVRGAGTGNRCATFPSQPPFGSSLLSTTPAAGTVEP
jgi:hypothetical protein